MSLQQAERGASERSLAGGGSSHQVPGTPADRAMRLTSAPGPGVHRVPDADSGFAIEFTSSNRERSR